jgi:hypothetical protein
VNFSGKPTRYDDEVTRQEVMMDEIQGLMVSLSFSPLRLSPREAAQTIVF